MEKSPITPEASWRSSLVSQFVRISDERGIILSIEGIRLLEGALYLDILDLCSEKEYNFFTLEEALRNKYQSVYIWHAVTVLLQKGYLENVDELAADTYCLIHSITDSLNLQWNACEQGDIPFISVLTDIFSIEAENTYKLAMDKGKNWLPVLIGGIIHSIGPVFIPGGFCLECFRFRIKENQSIYKWMNHFLKKDINSTKWIKSKQLKEYKEKLTGFANEWSKTNALSNKLIALSINSEFTHTFFKRPECHYCGDFGLVSKKMQAPPELIETNQVLDYKFGYRCSTPVDTWNRFSHLVSPVTGIIGNLHPIPGINKERFHVFGANFSIVPDTQSADVYDFKMSVFGKGRSFEAARVSAFCEGIERASARYRGDEPIFISSMQQLGNFAVAPSAFQHFTDEQLQYPERTLSLGPVPKSFRHNSEIHWLPAWSLRDNEQRFVPADAVLLGRPESFENRVAVFESNGLSAGNTKEEAILQGFLELIERDAVAIWWFNKLRRPSLNLDIMEEDAWFLQTIHYLEEEKTEMFFLDLTIDTKIPVVAAVGKLGDGWLAGYGCHFDARVAASRALSELVQIRALMPAVVPPETCSDVAYLTPNNAARKIDSDPRCSGTLKTTNSFIKLGVSILSEMNIDTIVVNCSRPDSEMPVMKVFAPALRAFRPRFGEGRLFDVPLELGLIPRQKSLLEMNSFWLTV